MVKEPKYIRATHRGDWSPPETGFKIECFVLENGDRVFSLRGTRRVLGLKGNGALAMPRLLTSNYLQSYLSDELKDWLEQDPIEIQTPNGKIIHGFKATSLVDLAHAFHQAKNDGVLNERQEVLADRLYKITFAFSKLGINALIDEITGYLEIREKNALQQLLAHYVHEMFQPWEKLFPDEFYKEIYRLMGWIYKGDYKHPSYVGTINNEFIYNYLPEPVMREVRKRKRGNEKIHLWLTSSIGKEHLTRQITSAVTLMRACDTWDEFLKLFNKSFKRTGYEQMTLDFSQE